MRQGCTLTLFSGTSFDGARVTIESHPDYDRLQMVFNDLPCSTDIGRWVVLGETAGYLHMDEKVNSLQCNCNTQQSERHGK